LFKHDEMQDDPKGWKAYEMELLDGSTTPKSREKGSFLGLHKEKKSDQGFSYLFQNEGKGSKSLNPEDLIREAQDEIAAKEQEAYEKGFAQGEKDGLELAEKKAKKVIDNMEALFDEFITLKQDLIRYYEKDILELTFSMTKKVVGIEMGINDQALRKTLMNALRFASEKSKISLRIHPDDYDYMEELKPELFSKFKEVKSLTIIPDLTVTRGGCYLETPHGDVDARVETQLEALHKVLDQTYEKKPEEHGTHSN